LTDKIDKLEYDISSFLESHEPAMLRWIEIVEGLWKTYSFDYKDKKGFGVAVSLKLNSLVGQHKLRHEDIYYGTANSKIPANVGELRKFDPFGWLDRFFVWRDHIAERKRIEREKAIKQQWADSWSYMELLAKTNPEAHICKEMVEIEKKNYRETGLIDSEKKKP
jgi:hypothetical protein